MSSAYIHITIRLKPKGPNAEANPSVAFEALDLTGHYILMIDVEQDILLLGDLNSWLLHVARSPEINYGSWGPQSLEHATEHPVASENLGRFWLFIGAFSFSKDGALEKLPTVRKLVRENHLPRGGNMFLWLASLRFHRWHPWRIMIRIYKNGLHL